jgi:ubiquinone biosynthesis protein UbiJ
VVRNLRWDAEEDLSRVVGDILAHRLMNAARALKDGQARAWRALGENLSEYFAEEQEVLVNRANLGIFNDELRTLRDDIARLDKRTGRLARHVAPASASASAGRR